MDKVAAREVVSDTLERSFDFGRFTDLVGKILKRFDRESAPGRDRYLPDSFVPHIAKLRRLGSYTDSDNNVLDILVVDLKKDTSLDRARSTQRNFVARCLTHREGLPRSGALVAFVAPNQADWRFSLVKMEYRLGAGVDVKKEITPARRYSFLVGEHERSHTAQSRLMPLLMQTHNPTLAKLEEAFSVEPVTKEFFLQYRALFVKLKAALDEIVEQGGAVARDFKAQGVDTGDFVKKLLGQIVFLYFLQKKGWFGVAQGAKWGEGSKQFLRELFERKHADYKNFFNDILEPLFYNTLAVERKKDWEDRFSCRIPFLNGGLFDPMNDYDWVDAHILLDDALFSNNVRTAQGDRGTGVFDVFDRYNFTVNEDEPLEKEVAVDPEMLGKVFENLLPVKDKKSKGAYYTPREVVHYMCQESLINYLTTELGSKVDKADIETLIRHGDAVVEHEHHVTSMGKEAGRYRYKMPEQIRDNAKAIDKKLETIRVCDPAVGSGAFLVGMMNEIIRARSVLSNYIKKKAGRALYDFKHDAIEKCLYGVDIDAGAVEIAKLRFWLSLVVDEQERGTINPLPNLDYKIVRGDVLLHIEYDVFNAKLFRQLESLKPLFFNETAAGKKQRYKKKIDELIGKLTEGHKKFDIKVYFSECFHGKEGFDLIIANPPYVQLQKNNSFLGRLYQGKGFSTFSRGGDIYQLFYEKGYRLLGDGSHLCYITSNKWMRAAYGKLTRAFFANTALHAVVDFGGLPVFEAGTNPAILLTKKAPPEKSHGFTAAVVRDASDILHVNQTVKQKGFEMAMSDLSVDGWTLESPSVLALMKKVSRVGTPLKEHVRGKVYRGFTTGYNEAFVVDNATKKSLIAADPKSADLIKPWLRGRDIKRWRATGAGLHFILIESSANRKWPWSGQKQTAAEKTFSSRYPAVHQHLSAYKPRLKKRLDQGEFWWELRSCSYVGEFAKPKIIYPIISQQMRAMRDDHGFYMNDKCFLIAGASNFLLAILNSTLLDFYFRHKLVSLGDPAIGGGMEFRKVFMQDTPIATHDKNLSDRIAAKAEKIVSAPESPATAKREAEIDKLVYQLYDLTPEEIAIVENR